MMMLTLIFRQRFKEEVQVLLDNQGITGYTMITGIGGSGESGKVSGSHGWKDSNDLLLVALEEMPMRSLIDSIKALHARLEQENRRIKIPLKAFLQPCEVIV